MKTSARYENKSQREREQCKYKVDSAAPPERPYWFPDERFTFLGN